MGLVMPTPVFQALRLLENHRFRKLDKKSEFNATWLVGEQFLGFYFLKKWVTKIFGCNSLFLFFVSICNSICIGVKLRLSYQCFANLLRLFYQ